jgi:alpha-galactosidase
MNVPWDLEFEARPVPGASIKVTFEAGASILRAALTNTSDAALHPSELRLESEMDIPAAGGALWIHGRYMQTDALVRLLGEPPAEGYDGRYVAPIADGRRYTSREVVAIHLPARQSPVLVIGCLRPGEVFFDIDLDVDEDETRTRQLALVFDLRGIELAPGASLELPPVVLSEGRDPIALIERFADEVAAVMAARVPAHVPTGWCSWYYFYNRVTEADVVANLAEMMRTKHPAEYVQIDDGFQSFTGDWLTPNAKFPSGMAALATRIGEAGYKPGLWLAPFVMHEDSAVLRDNPAMALKTTAGETLFVQTWLGRCAVLDCTHPDAETWLRNLVRTVVREWGYVYLKLDALSFAARPGDGVRYHAPGTTAPANLRRGLEIIREAAGDDTFILGCTCHFGPAIGLVDAMRVGPDVKELWADGPNPSVKHAMALTLQRNWMHNRWWANDPDCLIVRDTDTALTEPETRFLVTGIALSGGMVVASDDLPKLPTARRDMALALFPPPGVAAAPLDPLEGPVPSTWRASLGDGRFLVGALNWGEASRWVPSGELLQPGEVAFDVWNARVQGMGDQLLRPHEGLLWQVAGRGPTPRVVGDAASLTFAGLYQRPVSGRIQVRNDLDRPRTIAIEARGQVFEVTLAPNEMRWFD